ncbi:mitochondrial arginine transporter BAC [Salix suchowensis]|nr:mitochondrial arginine transporter BAC [Salix suchowensis]
MIIVIDRLKDCIEGQHHLLLGWLLVVPFFLAYILKQSSHCSIWWSYNQFRIMPIRATKRKSLVAFIFGDRHCSWRFYNVAFWTAVLPLDVAKTIIQTSPDKSSTRNPFLILYSIL